MTPTDLDAPILSKESLETEAQSWTVRAKSLPPIVDAESCKNASFLLRSVKGLRSDIARWFEPHVEAAMDTKRRAEAARKGLVDEKERMEAPLVAVEMKVKAALLAWETEQEAVRRREEQRLQELARQEAETRQLEAAAELEREGHATHDAGMLQEAEDILAQPIEAPVVSVAKLTPKVQGIVYRDNWKAHPEINVKTLAAAVAAGTAPSAFLMPNLTAINQWARATQGSQDMPGIRVFNDRQIAARG
jgi:hypothetical protein